MMKDLHRLGRGKPLPREADECVFVPNLPLSLPEGLVWLFCVLLNISGKGRCPCDIFPGSIIIE